MKIRPLNDRVVIRRKPESEVSAGGIVLPGASKENSNQGEVIEVGPGLLLDSGEVQPMQVCVGDNVVFHAQEGDTIKFEDDELVIVTEADIIAILH